ncbi:MAG: aminopeptidase [Alphaproteobacteria bacterium]
MIIAAGLSSSNRFIHVTGWFKNLAQNGFVVFLLIGLSTAVSGCSPFYVMRAAYEEGKILWRREPISEYLARPELNQDTQEKLRLVLAVRDYARDALKLNVGGSYSSYSYVDTRDLTYIVMAAPKTELTPYTWWFLIVGRVPYKGFFSKEDAEEELKRLQADGYDTYMRTSAAFSTLGWFDDPLLGHLLRFDKVTLANVIFHELLHSTIYVNGAGAFNESLANFVGHRAAIDFFRQRNGEESPEYREAVRAWEQEKEFADFIKGIVATLQDLYQRDIPLRDKLRLREECFARSKAEWLRRVSSGAAQGFRNFARQPLNNAVLIAYLIYLKKLPLFEQLYDAEGKSLARFVAVVREGVNGDQEPFAVVQSLLDDKRRSAANERPLESP